MIKGVHGLFYSSDPQATRAFIRDKLKLPYTDTGGGWLIFDLLEGDVGVHPINESGRPPAGTHDVSFYCDDIHRTVTELRSRGVQFDTQVTDAGFGLVTDLVIPGGVKVLLDENFPLRLYHRLLQAGRGVEHVIVLGQRGVPDPGKTIGQAGDVVWHTWKTPDEIFYPGGQAPPPWNQYGGQLPPQCTSAGASGTSFVLQRTSKVPGDIDNSAISNSRLRSIRQWRTSEFMSVSTVSSMPSGFTVPSLRARILS